jgi:membrane protein YqaA with SNARE-associated domain
VFLTWCDWSKNASKISLNAAEFFRHQLEPRVINYLTLFIIVLGVNLIPAFGPPTWSIIALYVFNSDLNEPAIVVVGALAAALGRYILGHSFRLLGGYLPQKTRHNIGLARLALERRRRSTMLALLFFALSPLPSAQLFEAAGLAGLRLLPFTTAFFLGRIVSYSLYAFTAKEIRDSSIGDSFRDALMSPLGLASQIVAILLLVALVRVDWQRFLGIKAPDQR